MENIISLTTGAKQEPPLVLQFDGEFVELDQEISDRIRRCAKESGLPLERVVDECLNHAIDAINEPRAYRPDDPTSIDALIETAKRKQRRKK